MKAYLWLRKSLEVDLRPSPIKLFSYGAIYFFPIHASSLGLLSYSLIH